MISSLNSRAEYMRAEYCPYRLTFKFEARTSRAVLHYKDTWLIRITDPVSGAVGIGECAMFAGLGCDDRPNYEEVLAGTCRVLAQGVVPDLADYPSIRFGVETAMADLRHGGVMQPFPGAWSRGESSIVINGLIWMGTAEEMERRVQQKLDAGFRCLKLKIGGVDFNRELDILRAIRRAFPASVLEIRLDANGAFMPSEALSRIESLSRYDIHSIEQPIKAGQLDDMAHICSYSAIPIALDEELIGVNTSDGKLRVLDTVRPDYVILKPSLCGGFSGADEWIDAACERGIGWWATSALESNIGLNAIAQWVSQKRLSMPQGLGTGALYSNNFTSPLRQRSQTLSYDPEGGWVIPELPWRRV
ncbi:MAG: o-succinylbenzoate synthase [Muribaculaceae bacterium]|nr:o-succinylbenzoate synthase [Muribaculaceae bacterium]